MLKRFFAPFRAKVAQAEQQGFGVFFLELYFYVLILIWIAYYIYLLIDSLNGFTTTTGQPWYILFTKFKKL